MSETPVVFWQLRPCWGLPNPSPFCMKVETWLRMTGIPYEARSLERPPRSASGKIPYLERADGSLLGDSTVILETLTRERAVALDQGLSDRQRALGVLLQRTFEEDLYFMVVADRWAARRHYRVTRDAYFGHLPWLLRALVVPVIRRKMLAAARGQGVLLLTQAEREHKGVAAIEAIATVLGDQPYFLGRPSSVDATAYAFLANLLGCPLPSATAQAVRAHPNLVAYCQRMRASYFSEWPAIGDAVPAALVS
jgi:glutathione S-transferase